MIPVSITPKAIEEIKVILEKKGIPDDYGLRIGVKGGQGCAGVNFTLGFDKVSTTDLTYIIDDVPVYIKKAELMYLIDKQVDFYEGSDARGFVVGDPEN
ncbi:MAG: iron-sulfur cluster assembly accessory protein [Cyclobacteriaceae bacterium]